MSHAAISTMFASRSITPAAAVTLASLKRSRAAVRRPIGLSSRSGMKLTTPTLEVTGALKVDETVTATGNISSSSGDVLAGPNQISLINHLTTAVTTGGGVSGPPQA